MTAQTTTTRSVLYSWGAGAHGQLMHFRDSSDRSCPSIVTSLFGFHAASVACGGTATIVATSDGRLFSSSSPASPPRQVLALRKRRVVRVAAGGTHSVACDDDGSAWIWGTSAGMPPISDPARVPIGQLHVLSVAAGGAFTVATCDGGVCFAWGSNGHGQLGLGDSVDRDRPQQVKTGSTPISRVACGGQHALFLTDAGAVLSCGSNRFGQLGLGDTADRNAPTTVAGTGVCVAVAAGDNHSFAVTPVRPPEAHNFVFAWGRRMQCGISSTENVITPTPFAALNEILTRNSDSVASIAGSGAFSKAHTAVLTAKGTLMMFGSNDHGQCGFVGEVDLPAPTPVAALEGKRVLSVACGWMHSAAIVSTETRPSGQTSSSAPSATAPQPTPPATEPTAFGLFEPLGNDAILVILSLLDESDLAKISQVNRSFRDLASNNILWQQLFDRHRFIWTSMNGSWESAILAPKPSAAMTDEVRLVRSWASAAGVTEGSVVWKLRFAKIHSRGSKFLFSLRGSAVQERPGLLALAFKRFMKARKEIRGLMVGLDAAGKTTILYKLKLGDIVTTIPTVGFNVETISTRDADLTLWDVGGEDKIRPLWRHYYQNTSVFIMVIDSNDRERIDEARLELHRAMNEEASPPVLCVVCNKQDLPRAMSASEVTERLDLSSLRAKIVGVHPTVAVSGEGLWEFVEWIIAHVPK